MGTTYPQPTNDELTSTDYQYIALTPFWFKIVQGTLSSLKQPEKWQDYTAEIDRQIHELMLSVDLP